MKHVIVFIFLIQITIPIFAQNNNAVIREIIGTVELKRSAAEDWVPAELGDQLSRNTIISTGIKSTAIIDTRHSVIVVRPLTSLSLEAIIARNNNETVNLNLSSGRIRVEVKPPAGRRANFNVSTPMTVASVRGTSFDLDTVNLIVREGAVRYDSRVNDAGNPVLVTANQSSWVDTDTGKPINSLDVAVIKRALPLLPGMEAISGLRSSAVLSSSDFISNNFGNIDIGVNLTNTNGAIDIGTNLISSQGSMVFDLNLINKN